MTSFSMANEPRGVMITASQAGARIVLDGTDMSNDLMGYDVQQRAGQPPLMVLHLRPGIDLSLEGVATLAVAQETPPGEIVASFLSGIDPAALDAAVLDRSDLDGGRHELTAALLRQLADMALGKAT